VNKKAILTLFSRSLKYQLKSFVSLIQLTFENLKFDFPSDECTHLLPKTDTGLWQLNPSVAQKDNRIFLVWRETNGAFSSKANLFGQMHLDKRGNETVNKVFFGELLGNGEVLNVKLLADSGQGLSLEDPRIFVSEKDLWIIATKLTSIKGLNGTKWSSTICLLSIPGLCRFDLVSPFEKNIEKNWVPAEVKQDRISVLYSSYPATSLSVDLTTGFQSLPTISKDRYKRRFNGGSQFVKLNNGDFIRVARRRVPFFLRGYCHISYLILHDSNFQAKRISKPFVFKKIGIEVCNGLALNAEGNFLISWGEEDRRMYVATIGYEELLLWFHSNSRKFPRQSVSSLRFPSRN
jgi:hypothetical protein